MTKKLYERFTGQEITNEILEGAVKLFCENYGKWGKDTTFSKPGHRVRVGRERLRREYLSSNPAYVRVTVDGVLAGNVLASRWTCNGRAICWITQLVVHRDYRERGLATGLMNELCELNDEIYGIASSHPAACMAAAKIFGNSIEHLNLPFVKIIARDILQASPVGYIRDAKLVGSLFDDDEPTGSICSLDTNFPIDHTEPLEALERFREVRHWPLGDLPGGHEFLVIVENRRRMRSKAH